MKTILMISIRNLFRQKRRNLLLGSAIAFGMMVLVIANSFSHGISDALLNRIIVFMAGHVEVAMAPKGGMGLSVIQDKDRILGIIKKNLDGIKEINEGIAVFGRVIGNGKSDNVAIVGMVPNEEFFEWMKVKSGNPRDMLNKNIENPIVLAEDKAKYLNVKVNDILRARFMNINKQNETARLTVVAITKTENMFMSMAMYLEQDRMKQLLGYRNRESGSLQVILHKPKTAIVQAEKLYKALAPGLALINGEVAGLPRKDGLFQETVPVTYLALKDTAAYYTLLTKNVKLSDTDPAQLFKDGKVMISGALADRLKLKAGDKVKAVFRSSYEKDPYINEFTVGALFDASLSVPDNVVLIPEKEMFSFSFDHAYPGEKKDGWFIPGKDNPLAAAFSTEWELMKRSRTTEEFQKKFKDLSSTGRKKVLYADVRTMFEMASQVLKLESSLNLITLYAVLILFFIILIGVLNTLRMTVRERTREIGTIRAIGMQKKDVRNSFLMETFFLTLFANAAGVTLAFIVMKLLTLKKFYTDSPFSILLVNNSLNFVPRTSSILFNMGLILIMAVVTAYFPARRAANLSAAAALRHYE